MPDDVQTIPQEPSGIDALRQAVDFVSRGKPLSDQMVQSLTRMLNDHQERVDLVQTVMMHFQIGRLLTVLQGMQVVESKIFEPTKMAGYTTREMLDLMKICQAEVHNITSYIDDRAPKPLQTSESGVKDVADPNKVKARSDAQERVGNLAPQNRRRIVSLLERMSIRGGSVVDVESTVTPAPASVLPTATPTPPPAAPNTNDPE